MLLHQDIYFNANTSILKSRELDGFLPFLKETMANFSEKSPSDGCFTIDLTSAQNGYKVVIRLASAGLSLCEFAIAQSPFAAVDKVLSRIQQSIDFWSVQKNMIKVVNI